MAFPPNFKPGAKGKPPMAKGKMAKPGGKGKPPEGRGASAAGASRAPKARDKKSAPSTPLDSETLGNMAQSLKGMSGAR